MSNCILYPKGQCTRYTCENFAGTIGPLWGNAGQWLASAQAAGVPTSPTPQVGAIAVWLPGVGGSDPVAGHVALVTGLNPQTVVSQDWPTGAGTAAYVIGAPGAPGHPSGYILPPIEGVPMDLDTARSIVHVTLSLQGLLADQLFRWTRTRPR